MLKRLVLALATLLACAAVLAATTAERSPFTQGHWWNASTPGSGFEIFNVGDQVMVIWYTYDAGGRPVWYTAQGSLADVGRRSWALLEHGWANGRKAAGTEVGTLRLNLESTDAAQVEWSVGGASGATPIAPFVVSGVINEVDHTGSWFNPDNSGWGITVTEQGDVLGGVLYTYDASGAPTWAAGFGRERGAVELFAFEGSCPSCAYRPSTSRSVGRLGFDFRAEAEAVLANHLALAMAPGVDIDGARVKQLGRPASARPADRQLAHFATRADLKAFLDEAMLNLRPAPAGADFSPAPAATPYSPTNLVESGVDEAGLVKTDGRHVYTFTQTGYRQPAAVRIARVDDDGASLSVRGTFALNAGMPLDTAQSGLYLHAGQLVAVTGTLASAYGDPWLYSGAWLNGRTHVEIMSLGADGLPAPRWRAEIEGYMVASRRIGDRLYVVSRFVPNVQGFAFSQTPAAIAANRALLAATPLAALLPKVRSGAGDAAELVDAQSVFLAPLGSRAPAADMIVVTAIDLAQARVAEAIAIAGNVETVYASPSSLYLATSRYAYRSPSGVAFAIEPAGYTTDIHQVRLGPSTLEVAASASVEGFLGFDLDQVPFRMSEHQDKLRVVTSSNSWWGGDIRNRVTILERSAVAPGLLRTVSYLPNARRPESLGKPGELLYGTRFVGERLYAVTFRQVDPLYVVDLSDASDPRITGALEVPGFSEYLHPLPNGLLLGFGKDATPEGLFQGLQLSLFDVSDAGKPRQVQKVVIGKRGSESALLRHHHAFSARQQEDGSIAVAIPARIHDGAPEYYGGSWAYYPWQESGLVRFEVRGSDAASARLVQLAPLISHRAGTLGQGYFADPAVDGGRSILFRGGTLYIGDGKFWKQDSAGNTAGPY